MWRDVRYGLRSLQRAPGFAIVAVVVLALGIGVNTATFSIINAVLLRPLPIQDADRVAFIYSSDETRPMVGRYDAYLELAGNRGMFAGAAASRGDSAKLRSGTDVQLLAGEEVSPNYFDVLGVRPAIGSGFSEQNTAVGAPPVVVISHSLWQRRLSSDPHPIGRILTLTSSLGSAETREYQVVGVMPVAFAGVTGPFEPTDYWVPAGQSILSSRFADRLADVPMVVVIARMQSGVTLDHVQAFATIWGQRADASERMIPGQARRPRIVLNSRRVVLPFDFNRTANPSRIGAGLMAVAGLVLLIGLTNLAGIVMARGVARRGEIAVQLTLGASRWRVGRQLFMEGLVLAGAGGLVGLALSRIFITLFLENMPGGIPGSAGYIRQIALGVPLDVNVLVFTAGVSLLVGLAVGLAELRNLFRLDLLQALAGAAAQSSRRTRLAFRHWIVIPQVCVSLALLLAAGVAVKSLLRVALVAPGYDPARAVLLHPDVPTIPGRSATDAQKDAHQVWRRGFFGRLLALTESTPGVEAAALADGVPPQPRGGEVITGALFRQGGAADRVGTARVTPGYFSALGIPLVAGRLFDRRDMTGVAKVAVVDQTFASRHWPGRNPVGERVAFYSTSWPSQDPPDWLEVVGVVGAVHRPSSEGAATAFVYAPMAELPYTVLLVTRGNDRSTKALIASLREVVAQTDSSIGILSARSLEAIIDDIRYPRRIAASLLGFGGLVGLLLASTGLFGVVSYSVAQRFRELGIRAALGASRRDITSLMLKEAGRAVVAGVVFGFVLGFIAIRIASARLVPIGDVDVSVMIGAPLVLVAVVFVACYLPARRAARVDPVQVLRNL